MLAIALPEIVMQQLLPVTGLFAWNMPYPLPFTPDHIRQGSAVLQAAAFLIALGLLARMELQGEIRGGLFYTLCGIGLVGVVAATVASMAGSGDIYYYIAYGRELGVLHLTPYNPLINIRSDPVIREIPTLWIRNSSLYGPTAVLWYAFLNLITKPTLYVLVPVFKAAWLGLFLLFSVLLYRLLKTHYSYPYTRWFALCANPVTWLFCVRDAHVEMLMALLILFCLMAAIRRKWLLCGLVLALLCTTKIVMLIVVPFFALHVLRDSSPGQDWPQRRKSLVHFLAGFGGYFIAVHIIFNGGGLPWVLYFGSVHITTLMVIPWMIQAFSEAMGIHPLAADPFSITRVGSAIVFLLGFSVMFIQACRARTPMNPAILSGMAMIFFISTLSYQWPWYSVWGIVFLIIAAPTLQALLLLTVFYTLYGTLNMEAVCPIIMVLALTVSAWLSWWKQVPHQHLSYRG